LLRGEGGIINWYKGTGKFKAQWFDRELGSWEMSTTDTTDIKRQPVTTWKHFLSEESALQRKNRLKSTAGEMAICENKRWIREI